jgi:hypothetical protein
MARDRPDDPDRLFEVPPARFVRERNVLAARLRESGRAAEAAAVKRLRRPNTTVWTVNRLARQEPQRVRRLVDAVERLKTAQRAREGVAEAVSEQRAALHDAVAGATALLEQAGLSRSPDALERIARTLVGAAADRETRAALLHGRLTREHAPPGFDVLTGAAPAARRRRGSTAPPRAVRGRARAAKAARAAARRVRSLERVARRRQREAERAEKSVTALRRRLSTLERAVADKRAVADAAMQAARRAREETEHRAPRLSAGGS